MGVSVHDVITIPISAIRSFATNTLADFDPFIATIGFYSSATRLMILFGESIELNILN